MGAGFRPTAFWKEEGAGRLVEHGAVQHLFESPKEALTAAYERGRRG
jgi:phosphate transport system ATP-binding protein